MWIEAIKNNMEVMIFNYEDTLNRLNGEKEFMSLPKILGY